MLRLPEESGRIAVVSEGFRSGEEECRGAFAVPREVVVAVDAPAVVETDVHAVLEFEAVAAASFI